MAKSVPGPTTNDLYYATIYQILLYDLNEMQKSMFCWRQMLHKWHNRNIFLNCHLRKLRTNLEVKMFLRYLCKGNSKISSLQKMFHLVFLICKKFVTIHNIGLKEYVSLSPVLQIVYLTQEI